MTKFIENIRENRDDLHEEVIQDEQEKHEIEQQIMGLNERLVLLSEALVKKYEAREEFDRTISETEQAFMRILESSQTLLHVLKKEDSQLQKRKLNVTGTGRKTKNDVQQSAEKVKPVANSHMTKHSRVYAQQDQSRDYSPTYSESQYER